MKENKRKIFEIFSELFINLASGFLGAAVIIPIFSQNSLEFNFAALTLDLTIGIFLIVLAFYLKK